MSNTILWAKGPTVHKYTATGQQMLRACDGKKAHRELLTPHTPPPADKAQAKKQGYCMRCWAEETP